MLGFRPIRTLTNADLGEPSAVQTFQPEHMKASQLAAVSYLARYSGHTHSLYASQRRRWVGWCEQNGLDPLVGVQRAHVELYIRDLRQSGRDGIVGQHLHARGPRVLPVRAHIAQG